jgi:hypothetical protein
MPRWVVIVLSGIKEHMPSASPRLESGILIALIAWRRVAIHSVSALIDTVV